MRADRLRLTAIGVFPIKIDHAALFTADDQAMEDRIEQEILDLFGGFDSMVKTFEAEVVGVRTLTATEAIAYLRALAEKEKG